MTDTHKIAIVGGTGDLGSGLAKRWARAGHQIVIGSRDAGRGAETPAKIKEDSGTTAICGVENADAAEAGEIVVLTVPYENHAPTLDAIRDKVQGKIVIDVTVPLMPPKVRTVQLPEGGSCAKAAQAQLGDDVRVVSAFQNVAATHLADLEHVIDCDVLVCGNDPEAREVVVKLSEDASMKAWHAGVIANSAISEALTSALIFMNGRYKIDGAGIRITGTPGSATKS
ncbi:MAG: NADPH-dependent F420 reductase [Pseudomonadota bacterium]|nr:NADPH-dependent F420 reductase [Pseudomonadota bacterium]